MTRPNDAWYGAGCSIAGGGSAGVAVDHERKIERLVSAPVAASNDREPELVASEDGTPIAVWRSGEGKPLVLVHGTAADHTRWAPVLPALEARFCVLNVDRRGRGRSGDAATYALEREFEDIAAVVEWAGDERAPTRALVRRRLLARSRPSDRSDREARALRTAARLRGIAPGGRPAAGRVARGGREDELVVCFMREVVGLPPDRRRVPSVTPDMGGAGRGGRHDPAGGTREPRVPVRAGSLPTELRVPTLFLEGGDSADPFKEAAAAVGKALPDCQVVTLPGQRHAAMDTAPELFTAEVLAFLDST